MEDIKTLTAKVKENLKQYGFKQKGSSREFFYDEKWYIIIAQLDTTPRGIIILNGIKLLWNCDKSIPIREVTKNDLLYTITECSPVEIEKACAWVNSKKELFLNLYEKPENMLTYFRNHKDAHRYPHDYILARMLHDNENMAYFEKQEKDHLQGVNAHPGIYFTYGSEKGFHIRETDVNHLMELDDEAFADEIIKRINENRKKLKLVTYSKYFE